MNIRNISKGQIIHNYPELCRLLEIEEKEGSSKAYQIKEIERFIKFSKNGHKIIIDEIYETEIDKIDNRKLGNRSKYVDDISIQILEYIQKNKYNLTQNEIFLTASEIFFITGMVNEKYTPSKKSIDEYLKQTPSSLKVTDVKEFFFRTEGKMRSILSSALKNLKTRYMIIPNVRHKIKENNITRLASKTEEEWIMTVKNEVLNEMIDEEQENKENNVGKKIIIKRNIIELYLRGRSTEFYERVNEKLSNKYGWDSCFSGFEIQFGEKLEEGLQLYKDEIEHAIGYKYGLNSKVAEFINKDAEKKYLKNKKEYKDFIKDMENAAKQIGWGGEISQVGKKKKFVYSNKYLDGQYFLTDDLIRLPKKLPKIDE